MLCLVDYEEFPKKLLCFLNSEVRSFCWRKFPTHGRKSLAQCPTLTVLRRTQIGRLSEADIVTWLDCSPPPPPPPAGVARCPCREVWWGGRASNPRCGGQACSGQLAAVLLLYYHVTLSPPLADKDFRPATAHNTQHTTQQQLRMWTSTTTTLLVNISYLI